MNGRNGSLTDQFRATRDEAMAMRSEVGQIAGELQRMMQMEMELARAEAREATGHAGKGAGLGAGAAVFGIITSVFLFLAVMFALDTALPLWASALITAGIAALLTGLLALLARQQLRAFSPVPRRFIRSMQEDLKWASSQLRLNGR